MSKSRALNPIELQIIWTRLLAVVEEQAQTLIRTAFSTTVREAGDLSCGVFDTHGRMLAQAITGTPGHVNAMAASVKFFLRKYPLEILHPGDVLLTNDPWYGTGHLNDFTVVTPVFRDQGPHARPVALFAATSHIADVGGWVSAPTAARSSRKDSTFRSAICFGPVKPNEILLEILRANVRDPRSAEGDLYSLTACNRSGAASLCRHSARVWSRRPRCGWPDDHRPLARGHAGRNSQTAGRELAQRACASTAMTNRSTWYAQSASAMMASMSISQGTSAVCGHGINVPITYTQAYASFGVRCVIGNDVPNNAGSLEVVQGTRAGGTAYSMHSGRPRCRPGIRSARCCPTWCWAVWNNHSMAGYRPKGHPACSGRFFLADAA